MKTLIVTSAVLAAVFAMPAFAGKDMASMDMPTQAPAMKVSSSNALTDAEVKKVDAATGMVTLKHGALENVGMPPMTIRESEKMARMPTTPPARIAQCGVWKRPLTAESDFGR